MRGPLSSASVAVEPTYADVQRARDASDVGTLLAILDHARTELRVAAAADLGEIGEKSAVDSLRRALRSPDPILRVACLKALGDIGDPGAGDAVALALESDDDLAIQTRGVLALLQLGDQRAADTLIRLAFRKDVTARHTRRWAIRQLAESPDGVDADVRDRIVASLSIADRLRLRRAISRLRR